MERAVREELRLLIDRAARLRAAAEDEWMREMGWMKPQWTRTARGQPRKVACIRGHEYKKHGRIRPDGSQCCRICDRERKREFRIRHRQAA